jgi:hypothetical protein
MRSHRENPPLQTQLLGNDLVDLGDPETLEAALHPRFDKRVFSDRERARIYADESRRHRSRWQHWALKEAAYKAVRRRDPRVVFSPRRLSVELLDDVTARVSGFGLHLEARLEENTSWVHAVVYADVDPGDLYFATDSLPEATDCRDWVRSFAARSIEAELGFGAGVCFIPRSQKLPALEAAGKVSDHHLSLSHHGGFVAFACAPHRGAKRPEAA